MEEKLQKFINDNSFALTGDATAASVSADNQHVAVIKILSDGSARFVHHQLLELAADILQKSRDNLLSSVYFYDVSQSLDDLLTEVRFYATYIKFFYDLYANFFCQAKEKSPESFEVLSNLARKLMLIVSRTARLLECLVNF